MDITFLKPSSESPTKLSIQGGKGGDDTMPEIADKDIGIVLNKAKNNKSLGTGKIRVQLTRGWKHI